MSTTMDMAIVTHILIKVVVMVRMSMLEII